MLRAVKSVLAWLAVNALLIAINLVAAGMMYALFRIGQTIAPAFMEEPLVVIPLGLLAIASAIWLAFVTLRELNARQRPGRARARA